jgi:glucokinase
MRAMLGLDLGGTQIKSGLVLSDGTLQQVVRTPTPQNDPTGLEAVEALAEAAKQYSGFDAVGLVVPGLVDAKTGVCKFSGTLGWRELPIAQMLQEKITKPVFLEHDVTAGGVAELVVGAAKGVDRGVVIAMGTALAAALIIDGKIFHPHPSVGEVGHAPLPNDRPCVCGKIGCVEMTVSGGALQRNYEALTGTKLSASEIVELAKQSQPEAAALVQELVHGLGFSITWLASTIAPQVVVLAGGLATAGAYLTDALAKELDQQIGIQLKPEIRVSELGGNSGCIGAGLVAHNRMSQ